jgi:hypothetical protein
MLLGSTLPRIYTRQSEPSRESSQGFEVIEFAESLGFLLFEWQKWLLIQALATNADGSARWSKVCAVLGRQNGKSTLLTLTILFKLTHGVRLILASSASRDVAMEAWKAACDIAEEHPEVFGEVRIGRRTGHEVLELLDHRSRYKPVAKKAGRGLTSGFVVIDELKVHHDWLSVAALESTVLTTGGQIWLISNQGDVQSVVLSRYREIGIAGTDPGMFFAEWSAPDGSEIDDRQAWAAANPSLGQPGGVTEDALRSLMSTQPPAIFKSENLCMAVPSLDGVVSPEAFDDCRDPVAFSDEAKAHVVCGIDISGEQISLVAAATLSDGRIRVERVRVWQSPAEMRMELSDVLSRVQPTRLGWFPESAGAIAIDLKAIPVGVEISGREVANASAELVDLIRAGRIAHDGDPLIRKQLTQAKRQAVSEGWKFSRRFSPVDCAYAVAAAVYLARRVPEPEPLVMYLAPY